MQTAMIELTNRDRARARRWSDRVLRNLPKRPNYTGFEREDRYYTGYLGEIGTAKWAESQRAIVMHRVRTDGHSQRHEILVDVNGFTQELEVKTGSKAWHRYYCHPEKQKKEAAYYVGVRLHEERAAEVMGWVTKERLLSVKPEQMNGGEQRAILFSTMEELSELAAMFYPLMPETSFAAWQGRINPRRELPADLF